MPQANSHSTWALASQGVYLWQIANCGRRYATVPERHRQRNLRCLQCRVL